MADALGAVGGSTLAQLRTVGRDQVAASRRERLLVTLARAGGSLTSTAFAAKLRMTRNELWNDCIDLMKAGYLGRHKTKVRQKGLGGGMRFNCISTWFLTRAGVERAARNVAHGSPADEA